MCDFSDIEWLKEIENGKTKNNKNDLRQIINDQFILDHSKWFYFGWESAAGGHFKIQTAINEWMKLYHRNGKKIVHSLILLLFQIDT